MDYKEERLKLNWDLWKDIPDMIAKKKLPANFVSGRLNPIDSGKDWVLNFSVWAKRGVSTKKDTVKVLLRLGDADLLFGIGNYPLLDHEAGINAIKLSSADLGRIRLLYIVFSLIREVVSIIKYGNTSIDISKTIMVDVTEQGLEYHN